MIATACGPVASAVRRTLPLAASLLLYTGCASAPAAHAPATSPLTRAERRLAVNLDAIFNAPETDHALWAVEVKSLDTGRVWYSRNARTLVMPASNMKIVTLAAAAEILGWDYRFKTTLETSAPIEDGVLRGDLVVRGGGDPTINGRNNRASQLFDEWAAALRSAGIRRIDGKIVGDGRAFDPTRFGQGWSWDYLQYGYAAPIGALEFNENVAALTIRPGGAVGEPASLALPAATGLGLVHHAVTGAAGSPTTIEIRREPDAKWLDVSGSIAVDAQPASRDVAVASANLYFAYSLLQALAERGIEVHGLPVEWKDDPQAAPSGPSRVLVESTSPPLRDIATTMMKVSQNLYAETLLKAVGAAKSGGPGSTESGATAAKEVFTAWGIPTPYVQADGSGLSRYDFVSAEMLTGILEHLFKDRRHRDTFVATLPIAGKDGTIATRLRATRAEANAVAKTGSIANVRALSGYVKTQDGEQLVFSILANNFAVPAATVTSLADRAVEALANHTRRR